MKKYLGEIIILGLQLFMFYIYPLLVNDPMAMVLIILLSTILLASILMQVSKNKIKYLYPIVISILFIPSVFIYYNESALVHALWYLVTSTIGMGLGSTLNWIIKKVVK